MRRINTVLSAILLVVADQLIKLLVIPWRTQGLLLVRSAVIRQFCQLLLFWLWQSAFTTF